LDQIKSNQRNKLKIEIDLKKMISGSVIECK